MRDVFLPFQEAVQPTRVTTAAQEAWTDEQERLSSLRDRIWRALQDGPKTNLELRHICIDYRTRISELRRKQLCVIVNERIGPGVTRYTLR
jgi:hypothetical protein